jgi:hypothetical protein
MTPPGFPPEEEKKPANLVIPIQVSDVEYALLMRALCPTGTHAPEEPPVELPALDAPGAGEAAQQSLENLRLVPRERPPGTPIV